MLVFHTASASVGIPQYPLLPVRGKQVNPGLHVRVAGPQRDWTSPTKSSSKRSIACGSGRLKVVYPADEHVVGRIERLNLVLNGVPLFRHGT